MAFDGAGNLFIANEGAGGGGQYVSKLDPVGNLDLQFSEGYDGPSGVAFNSAGELFISDDTDRIFKVDTSDGTRTVFIPQQILGDGSQLFENANAIAFDSDDFLFVVNANGYISKFDPSGALITRDFSTGFNAPQSIVIDDNAGLLYTSDFTGQIYQIDKSTGDWSVYVDTGYPFTEGGLAMDDAGTLYYSAYQQGKALQIHPSGQVVSICISGLVSPRGLTFDSDGALLITDYATGEIYRFLGCEGENSPPEVGPISAPVTPVRVGFEINATAEFTDPDPNDNHSAVWDWGDNQSSAGAIEGVEGGGIVSGEHVYLEPGVYTLTLTVFDDHGNSGESVYHYVVVFEPSAGFVTGGGWIHSPEGAYVSDPTLSGKATFGFVSKYKRGRNTPEGNTEFQFRTADLNFKSTSYQWLVVAGRKAQFKGEGTINGGGSFGFMLTAIDGDLLNGDGLDRFRIKIWDKSADTMIYDNQISSPDDADPTTVLGGGSIVIHRPIKVGLVTDMAGIADMGWNWLAYQGLLRAGDELGIQTNLYQPASTDDFEPFLQQCVDEGNQLCIGVGFLLNEAIMNAANNNPDTAFAILDFMWEQYPANLRGILFAADEVGYLAGVLAGRMTSSNIIGTFGGLPIPPVEEFMFGFRNGAQCVNPDVEVFMDYSNDFGNPALGATIAQNMMGQGADVIFPVAGPTGNGALLATTQAMNWAVGVDTDQYLSVFENGAVTGSEFMLTSAMKNLDNAVFMTIADLLGENFTPGTYRYGLDSEGVGLAPFHEADPSIPSAVKDELIAVQQGIIDGTIDIYEQCRPIGSPARPIKIFFTPNADPQVINEGGSVMAEYLNQATGLSFEIIVPDSPADTVLEMCASPEDSMGFIPGVGYVLANDLCGVDVSYKAIRFGWDVYWSEILVPRDSTIQSIAQLDDLTWAIPSFDSFSGYLAPLVMWSNAGITPGAIVEAGSHPQAVMAVYNGEADFATAYFSPPIKPDPLPPWEPGDPPDIPTDLVGSCALNEEDQLVCDGWRVMDARASVRFEAPDVVQNLRILDISDPIANDGLAFGPGFPVELRTQVEAALTAFAETGQSETGPWWDSIGRPDFYNWSGISPAVDSDYDSTRDIVAAAGITLENWGQPQPPEEPSLHVVPAYPEIHGHAWPDDSPITVEVEDLGTGESPDFSDEKFVYEEPTWCGEPCFDLQGSFDIMPNQVVTMSNGEVTRVVHVTSLTVTGVDPDADTVSGTAAPFSEVWVDIHTDDGVSRHVAADGVGNWIANFHVPGDEEWENNTYDLGPGIGGRSIQFEDPEAGDDGTLAYWHVPNPTIAARPDGDLIEGWEWPEGIPVTIFIDDVEKGTAIPYYPEGDPNAVFDFFLENFDLEPGQVVRVTNDDITKVHIVTNHTVLGVDPDSDTVWGTAEIGTEIIVWMHEPDSPQREVIAEAPGEWSVSFAGEFDIQPGTCGTAAQLDEDWDQTWIDWCVPNPNFAARPEDDFIEGWDWPAGIPVNISIDGDPKGTAIPDYPEGESGTIFEFSLEDFDLAAGQLVSITNTETTKDHNVTNLVLLGVDPGMDTVWGTADSGTEVMVWAHEHGSPDIWVTADGDGNWTADFAGQFDIQLGTCGAAIQPDDDWDMTRAEWCVPNPHFSAKPVQHAVEVWEWPIDTSVTLTINSAVIGTATTSHPDWDPSTTFARFDLDFDLLPGDVIEVSGGGITKVHILTDLTVDPINPGDTAVSGTAALGSEVQVWLYECEEWVIADVDIGGGLGSWTVDFSSCRVLEPGDNGAAIQRDDDNDETEIEWRMPNPTFAARPLDHFIEGWDWPEGFDVDLYIDDVFISTAAPYYPDWDPMTTRVEFSLGETALLPGQVVRLTNGTTIKEHIVTNLVVLGVDPDLDQVWGTAASETQIRLWVHEEDSPELWVTADEFGDWSADFAGEFDIQPGTCGAATQPDEDWDETWIDWCAPDPRFTIQPYHQWAHGHGWPLYTPVTISIYDSFGGTLIHSETNSSGGTGDMFFELYDAPVPGLDLAPGWYVEMTDGTTLKTHVILDVTFDFVDEGTDTAGGTGPADHTANVGVHSNVDSFNIETVIGPFGDWFADFGAEGYDIHDVTDAYVEVWDNDGDATLVHFDFPSLHVVPAYPEVHGHGWSTDLLVTLIVGDPLSPDYSASKMVLDEPTWCGQPCFDLDGVFTIAPGQVITMTNGHTTKTVHVTSLMITSVDPASNTVSGTAAAFSEVRVDVHSGGGASRQVTADAGGNWFADFSVVGTEDFEQDIYDIMPGTDGRAIQYENDYSDDGTLAYWDLP